MYKGLSIMPEEKLVSRREHEEFARRLDAENQRQNNRIASLETSMSVLHDLTSSVAKLAVNIETMTKEIGRQGQRLEVLESRDGEMWRKVTSYVMTTIIGLIVGAMFAFHKP